MCSTAESCEGTRTGDVGGESSTRCGGSVGELMVDEARDALSEESVSLASSSDTGGSGGRFELGGRSVDAVEDVEVSTRCCGGEAPGVTGEKSIGGEMSGSADEERSLGSGDSEGRRSSDGLLIDRSNASFCVCSARLWRFIAAICSCRFFALPRRMK